MRNKIVVGTFVENGDDMMRACRLIRSLRTYGGKLADLPVWVGIPMHRQGEVGLGPARSLAQEVVVAKTPEDLQWLFYSGKPFAAARMEKLAADYDVIAWLDNDTIILDEPAEFDLAAGIDLAYRPVMHNRAGSLWNAPPSPYWERILKIEGLSDDQLFPMTSQADEQIIRPFFQAGVLIARVSAKIMHRWQAGMEKLGRDAELAELCRTNRNHWVFLHQAALVGAVINTLSPVRLSELPDSYNYPLFFDRQYESLKSFASIENVVTMRCVVSFKKLEANWSQLLSGDTGKISWLRHELSEEG